MSMEQEGIEKSINLEEKGYLAAGGGMDDVIDKAETVIFAEGIMLSETPTRVEAVVIDNT